ETTSRSSRSPPARSGTLGLTSTTPPPRDWDQDRQEGVRDRDGDPRRGARGGSLLRLDRRSARPLRRHLVPAALHAPAYSQQVVPSEPGEGGRADRARADAAGRPSGGGAGEGRRTLGRG